MRRPAAMLRAKLKTESILWSVMILALACAAAAAEAQAKTIYVSPTGSDDNPGTKARPVATASQAMDMAAAGDTIYFRAGRYNLSRMMWVSKPGVTIASSPGERARLVAGTNEGESTPSSLIAVVASNVTIRDLEIEGGSYYGIKIDVENAASTAGVVIRNCYIHHTGRDGIKAFNADNLLIEDCEIGPTGLRESNAEGIDCIGSIGVIIRRNYIHDTASSGVYLKGGARDGLIEQCRIVNAGNSGLLFGQDTDPEFMRDGTRYEAANCIARNNIIVNTTGAGIGAYSGNNIRFYHNTLIDVAKTNHAGFYVVTNNAGQPSRRVQFKNNIVVMTSARPMAFIINLADQLVSDSNIWFRPSGGAYKFSREARPDKGDYWESFADWQKGMGADKRSIVADPKLDARSLYKPLAGSPAIDRGESLPDVAADYSGAVRPQGRAPDIGAQESALEAGQVGLAPEAFGQNEAAEEGKGAPFVVALSASGGLMLIALVLICRRRSRSGVGLMLL